MKKGLVSGTWVIRTTCLNDGRSSESTANSVTMPVQDPLCTLLLSLLLRLLLRRPNKLLSYTKYLFFGFLPVKRHVFN